MRAYQDPEGRIIDPVKKAEKYYATPSYAHAVAVLAHSGQTPYGISCARKSKMA
jgi:hypothetical protein